MMYTKYVKVFLVVIHFLVFQATWVTQVTADDFSPPESQEELPEFNSRSEPPVKTIALGSFIITLEKTTLQEIQDAVGAGVIHHRGDAGGSESWLCYRCKDDGNIWIASGELGGNENFVTTIYAVTDTELKSSAGCPELPAQFYPVTINGYLWTGSSLSQLEKYLGAPEAEEEGWVLYAYLGKVTVNNLEMDRLTVLNVRINGGRVVTLVASQATTN